MLKEIDSIRNRIVFCFLLFFFCMLILVSFYFFNFRRAYSVQAEMYFNQLSKDMEHQIENKLDEIERTAKSCGYYSIVQKALFSKSLYEKNQYIGFAREIIFNYKDTYPYIKDIFLYINGYSHLFSNSTYSSYFYKNLKHYDLYDDVLLKKSFISPLDKLEKSNPLFFFYTPVSNILFDGTAITSKNDAICAVLCDLTVLFHVPDEFKNDDTFFAFFYDDEIIFCNNEKNISRYNEYISCKDDALKKKSFYYESESQKNWKFVCLAPVSAVAGSYVPSDRFLYIIAITGTMLTLILLFYFMNRLAITINSFIGDLNRLKTTSDKIRLKKPHAKEMRLLAERINEMLDRLDSSTQEQQRIQEQLYKSIVAQQESEMIAYRSQINPHFLFNTMECIRSMAQYFKVEPIEEIISAMSRIFRYSLYARKLVPLSEEITYVKQYLKVMEFRYPELYNLEVSVNEQTAGYEIPPMILQPLVENCIMHGFTGMGRKDHCTISINAVIDDDGILLITVSDNGLGIKKERLLEIEESLSLSLSKEQKDAKNDKADSIGLNNIYRRLKLSNKDNTMNIMSEEGKGTEIHLHVLKSPF